MMTTEPTSGPRYAVFAGTAYYPNGGWKDLVCLTHNVRDAERSLMGKSCDWWHIVDLYTATIIESSDDRTPVVTEATVTA